MKSRAVLWLAGLVLLGTLAFGAKLAVDARRPKGTDQQQLRQMLLEGEMAAERGNASGITKFISPSYEDSAGMNDDRLVYQIRAYFRDRGPLEVNIPSESIDVNLDPGEKTGTVRFQLLVGSQVPGSGASTEMELGLKVAKEPVYYYWIFPGEEWRVTGADGYGPLEQGF
jgi:hypothetical protein